MNYVRKPALLVSLWFATVVALITGTWWARPGYVWLLDSVWGPHQAINWTHPDTSIIWQVIVHVLTLALSGPVAQKLVLSGVLMAIGLFGYFFGRRLLTPLWAWSAATMYLLNPFVYERLVAGQWIVLAGYAALPLSVGLAWDVLHTKGRAGMYRWSVLFALYPLISPHFAYINAFVCVALAGVYIALERPRWLWSRPAVWWALALGAGTLAANWVWIASSTSGHFQSFSTIDFSTFRTAADPVVGVWGNVLGLYGFWRESAYIEPKDLLGWVWIVVAATILALSIVGAVRAFRQRHPLAMTLAISVPLAVIIAVGYASPTTRPLADFLIRFLPGFKGLRDSGKLVGVIALAYAALAPYGAVALVKLLPAWRPFVYTGPAALVLFAAVSTTGIWNGFGGQVTVAAYPPGWYSVRTILNHVPDKTVLILPWHEYLNVNFADSYTAQPAAVFFTNPLVSSDELDNILTARPDTASDRLMLAFTNGQIAPRAWSKQLLSQGVTYIVLEKTDDWANYLSKLNQAGLTLKYQSETIALYELPADK